MASKKIIEITTYCDEKKGMFDKTKKRKTLTKKKIENIPNFFLIKYWPKPKTKIEGNNSRWDIIITHITRNRFPSFEKRNFSIKKVNGPNLKKNVICLFQLKMIKKNTNQLL